MKELKSPEQILQLCKALGSDLRMQIILLLRKNQSMNLNELSEALGVTNGAMTSHIKLLSEAGIIQICHLSGKRGSQKSCSLKEKQFFLDLADSTVLQNTYETEIPIGQYNHYQACPTCGISTPEAIIGQVDDVRYFDSPMRYRAGILWFTKGFLEYRIPNYLKSHQTPTEIQISFEISSEAPGVDNNWPSDISFFINDIPLGYWTSPGDFGDTRGIYSPSWWPTNWNQYGLLKLLSINRDGTFIDGQKIYPTTIGDLGLNSQSEIRFRFSAGEAGERSGGFTLFGKGFGNYNQDIRVCISYEEQLTEE